MRNTLICILGKLAQAGWIVFTLTGFHLPTPDPLPEPIRKKLEFCLSQTGTERVYLSTDRFVYRPGEDLWFRGFIPHSSQISGEEQSEDLFIQLLNSHGEEIVYRRYPINDNLLSGRFMIPRTSIPGKYYLVAYTSGMRNQCPSLAFKKEILISRQFDKRIATEITYDKLFYFPGDSFHARVKLSDPSGKIISETEVDYSIGSLNKSAIKGTAWTNETGIVSIKDKIPECEDLLVLDIAPKNRKIQGSFAYVIPGTSSKPVVHFYPEGGNLVAGFNQTIAFRSTSAAGIPAPLEAEIVSGNGRVFGYALSDQTGQGKFEVVAGTDTLFLRIRKPLHLAGLSYPLPVAQKTGVTLSFLGLSSDSANFLLRTNRGQDPFPVWVVALNGSRLVLSREIVAAAEESIYIPVADLQVNSLCVFVFDATGAILCSRMISLAGAKPGLSLRTGRQVYTNRQRVSLLVEFSGPAELAHLSVTAAVKSMVTHPQQETIGTTLSQHQCDTFWNRHFRANTGDLHGMFSSLGECFGCEPLMSKQLEKQETVNGISGRVMDRRDNYVQHAKIRVTHIPSYRFFETQSDELGRFNVRFGNEIIDFNYLNVAAFDAPGKVALIAHIEQAYANLIRNKLLQFESEYSESKAWNIIKFGEPDLVYALRYSRGMFKRSEQDSKRYNPVSYADYTSTMDIIQDIRPYDISGQAIVFRPVAGEPLSQAPLKGSIIALNGKLLGTSPSILESIVPSDITNINISTSSLDIQRYTPIGFAAVIEITTIQGMYRYRQPAFQINMDVLNNDKIFYSPDYAIENQTSSDYRRTLYWNPSYVIEKGKSAIITFYTSDVKGTFHIVAEGLDNAGNPLQAECTFQVE